MVEFTHSEAGLKIEGLEPSDTLLRFKLKRRRSTEYFLFIWNQNRIINPLFSIG